MIDKVLSDSQILLSLVDKCAEYNRGYTAGKKSSAYNLGITKAPFLIMKENALDILVHMEGVLDEALPMGDYGEPFCIIPLPFAALLPSHLIQRDAWGISYSNKLGRVIGLYFDIYISNFLPRTELANYAFFGTTKAVVFQVQEGLYKLVRPDWFGQLCFNYA